MKKWMSLGLVSALLLSTSTMALAKEDIPVRRVILSTSGLANFVHQTKVNGNAEVEFPVRFDQVDDLLKSLVIFDKGGKLGGVTLPGKKPLQQIFKDLPFTRDQLASPMLLLNAYQGAGVTLTGNGSTIQGRIVHVSPETIVGEDGKAMIQHRINVMTDDGLQQAVMENLKSVQFDDARIRKEINRALSAVKENGASERRTLSVSLFGKGARDVSLSYVVDAPLWKTAYRMVVPETTGKKGLLQGWAVIENMTAHDWNDVDLTLVSGNPVTFRQSLYESYYVDRPEIPVQVFGRVMPRTDAGAISAQNDLFEQKESHARGAAPMMKASRMNLDMAAGAESFAMADSAVASAPPMPSTQMAELVQSAHAANSAEATSQVLFNFPHRFNLKAGESMMLPFVSRDVAMDKVALYQPDTHARHPLAAVEIVNDGDVALPPGVLTLYEESALLKGTAFVGDANLAKVPAGEKRLVSYALDSKVTIDRDHKSQTDHGKITISKGVMKIKTSTRQETIYTMKAPAKETRVVIIEHPRQHGYDLVKPDTKDAEMTENHYRIKTSLKPDETKKLSVVLERDGYQTYHLVNMSTDQFLTFANNGDLDKSTRNVFEKLAKMRRAVADIEKQMRTLEEKKEVIFNDQQRLRENLAVLQGNSDVRQKYMTKLNAQEDALFKLEEQREDLRKERDARQAELSKEISEMDMD